MGREVESRVLEMRFDNKEFEKNASHSITTLGKLKQALDLPDSTKAIDGLNKATKSISLDGISSGIEALERRFSTFGIVGMRVIQNITDGIMGKLHSALNFVSNSIVSGGVRRAMNIENAHFQLQALLKDEAKVQAVMADAMESVDGTAYAYDEAAKAASQFSASGIQSGEEMLNALKGITGVAAMTNSEFESISQIFTTVAGNGRLMGDQLLQLSSRGLNAASTLADYFKEVRGQASMTEGDIRDMVSKGKISFKDFSDAMTWAFGDSAKRANETFNGALSNMKSALARIGAGFISPLVEQNGEIVNLFNALRVQINNVKSALVFDEQQSAISGLSKETSLYVDTISRFVTTGKMDFTELTSKILGTSKSEEELVEVNARLSDMFNEVKETGHLTTNMMADFKNEGISATSAIRDYLNGVADGSIKASGSVKMAVKELTGGTTLMNRHVEKLTEEGKISFDIFTQAMVNSSGAISEGSELISTSFKSLFSEIKEAGSLTTDNLIELNGVGLDATGKILKYFEGVKDGTIRATYATRQAIDEMTDGVELNRGTIVKFAEDGKISFDIFQSAMEESFGDSKALSKQFTDSFLDTIKTIVSAIENADLTKPMEALYYWVESGKNVGKGLLSVLKPIAKAFSNVFSEINVDTVIDFSAAVEELTAKMQLSEENSKNLEDAFTGIFDVAKLLIDIFVKLVGVFVPINKPLVETGNGVLGLAGSMGRALSQFTDFVRQSPFVREAYEFISKAVSEASEKISELIEEVKDFIDSIDDFPIVKQTVDKITTSMNNLANVKNPFARLNDTLSIFKSIFKGIDWDVNLTGFDKIKNIAEQIEELVKSNEGLSEFIENAKDFKDEVIKAFSLDSVTEKIEKFRGSLEKLSSWTGEHIAPFFEDISFGDVTATAGGIGIIYALIKASKAFNNVTSLFTNISGVLDQVGKTLMAYQKDLNANAIIKIALAIGILAASLTLLSFAKTDNLLNSALALSVIAAVLFTGASALTDAITALKKAVNRGKPVEQALNTFVSGLAKTMKRIGTAVKIKAIGSAVKDVAISIGIMAVAIAGLGYLYKKDKESLSMGFKMVEYLLTIIGGIIVAMSLIGQYLETGSKGFAAASSGVLMMMLSLIVVIHAMEKLFKIELPPKSELEKKLGILAFLFAGLGTLTVLVGLAGKIAGGQKLGGSTFIGMAALIYVTVSSLKKLLEMDIPGDYGKKLAMLAGLFAALGAVMIAIGYASKVAGGQKLGGTTFIGMAVLIYMTVSSLKKLLEMDIPEDYGKKLAILAGVFVALGAVMVAIGYASKISGGNSLKALGTLIGVSIFLAVAVGGLMVLSLFPGEKILKGAVSLGLVLVALGAALYGAGKVTDKDTYKTVLAMALTVGVITAALGILSIVKWDKLLKATLSLSAVLLALSVALKSAGKVENAESTAAILAMTMSVIAIAVALYQLAGFPWQNLLASAASISAVLLAFGKVFDDVLDNNVSKGDLKKIGIFLSITVALIPIGVALKELSDQPWDGMLAAGVAISAVMLAMGEAYESILGKRWSKNNLKKVGIFLSITVALLPIGFALKELSTLPWAGMLSASVSLSAVLLAMSAAFGVIALAKNVDIKQIGLFILACTSTIIIAEAIKPLAAEDWQSLLGAATALSEVILAMSVAVAICSLAGLNIAAALAGIAAFDLFVVNLGLVIAGLGALRKIDGFDELMSGGMELLVQFGQALGDFVGAIIGGIAEGIMSSFPSICESLSDGITKLDPFIKGAASIGEEVLDGCKYLAASVILLTGADFINAIGTFLSGGQTLSDLGSELSAFAISIIPFLGAMKLVDAESVEACKGLAEMIFVLTGTNIINGISQFFGLSGTLSEFGTELVAFGAKIAVFAILVRNVTEESVTGAASAAQIMAEVANKLPSQGGLKAKIFGEKSLSEFAAELIPFGFMLKIFANIVKDINPTAVIGAATVTSIMSTLANGLPTHSSLIAKIFGSSQRTLAEFGAELVAFGAELKLFADIVKDITPTAVIGTVMLTKIMTTLRDQMPESESLFDKIFGGNQMTLADFGKEMTNFAKYMKEFSEYAVEFNLMACLNLISGFQALIELSESLNGDEGEKIADFITALNDAGIEGVNTFVNAFDGALESVCESLRSFISTCIETIQLAIIENQSLVTTAVAALCEAIIRQFKTSLPDSTFRRIGMNVINNLALGMALRKPYLASVVASICAEAIAVMTRELGESKTIPIGQNIVNGMIKGIESKLDGLTNVLIQMAHDAAETVNEHLHIKSPSRVFFKIGQYVCMGLINGIADMTDDVAETSKEMAIQSVDPVKDVLKNLTTILQDEENFEINPRIVPVLDMTDVREGSKEINDIFDKSQQIDFSEIGRNIQEASIIFNGAKIEKERQQEEKQKDAVTNNYYNMEQNNYSPKALSRTEIYRQTNNQFSALKKVVAAK